MSDIKEKKKKETIQVVVRVRPPLSREANETTVVECDEKKNTIQVDCSGRATEVSQMRFDRVYGPESTQEQLYEETISPLVKQVLKGFNIAVFTYGQTGTGKTYTMEGADATSLSTITPRSGVIPRAFAHILAMLEKQVSEYSVKVSALELYNEEIVDLLAPESGDGPAKIRVFEDAKTGVFVSPIDEIMVGSSREVSKLFQRATYRRRTAETKLNAQSSRSHVIFTITIHMKEMLDNGEDMLKMGKLHLVDLAGSESVSKSGAKGKNAREAGNINKSLLALRKVVQVLEKGKKSGGFAPYRDSKLTHILKDALGGKTKTCIIATTSPCMASREETINTLQYATKAKKIVNKPEVNKKMSKNILIGEYRKRIEKLRDELHTARKKDGIYVPADEFKEQEEDRVEREKIIARLEAEMDAKKKSMQEMATMFESKDAELKSERKAHAETRGVLKGAEEELGEAHEELHKTEYEVAEHTHAIVHHERTELKLFEQNQRMAAKNFKAADDIERLHARVDMSVTLEARNVETVGDFERAVSKQVGAFHTVLDSHCESQSRLLTEMIEQVQRVVGAEVKRIEGVGKRVHKMHGQVATAHAEGAEFVAQRITEVQAQLAAYETAQRECMQSVDAALTSAHTSFAFAVDAFGDEMQRQRSVVEAYGADVASAVEAEAEHVRAFASEQATTLHGVSEAMGTFAGAHTSALNEQGDVLRAFADTHAAEEEAAEAELLSQIGALCANFFTRRQQRVADALSGVDAAWGGMQQAAADHTTAVGAQLGAAGERVDAFTAWCATHTEQREAAAGEARDTFATQHNANLDTQRELREAVRATVAAEGERETARHAGVRELVDVAVESASAFHENVHGMVAHVDAALASGEKAVHKSVATAARAREAQSKEWAALVDAMRSSVEESVAHVHGDVDEWKVDLEDFFSTGVTESGHTNSTPAKRQWNVPGALPATAPHELLQSKFRAHVDAHAEAHADCHTPLKALAEKSVGSPAPSSSGGGARALDFGTPLHNKQLAVDKENLLAGGVEAE